MLYIRSRAILSWDTIPLEIKSKEGSVYRCIVCGKIVTNPIFYKTCCMNKPVVFCSRICARRWISEWVKNQDQLMKSKSMARRRILRRDILY